ncbi:alpha/beta hydrolase [Streptomyces hirsutus]|uniref:alpha/beta hydrolase n=1 Tax=Streptomyces hirsutus TaxID=35620 RepID=UPI0006E3E8D9|nr:alpha/beta hydrolase [Streptomyces hirsutus]
MPADTSVKYTRTPYLVVQRDNSTRKDVYGTIGDSVVLQAQLLRGENPSTTCVVAMHPIGSPGYLPMFSALARAGFHVLAAGTRYSNGDAALIMENVLLDLGAVVKDAKERLGYERVVLAGWSGGGSLMMGYQAEAEKPVIKLTGAGEYTPLADTRLTPADGVMILAAHRSRHHLLTDFLDASILDESRPDERDPHLNLYSPENPDQPPYTAEFLAEYRAAQVARSRRITAYAQERLAGLKAAGRHQEEHCFVVQGTMADPRWLDLAVDPNDRAPGSYLGDPRLVNDGPSALGRFTTTRSWLSQWSYDTAQVDAADAASRVTVPVLLLENSRDDACPPAHPRAIYEGIAHENKQLSVIEGANHYYSGQKEHLRSAVDHIDGWLTQNGFDR